MNSTIVIVIARACFQVPITWGTAPIPTRGMQRDGDIQKFETGNITVGRSLGGGVAVTDIHAIARALKRIRFRLRSNP